MKKALSLILALALCLSLWACGGAQSSESNDDTPEAAILGEWKDVTGDGLTFLDDGTGIAPAGDTFDWRYDKESSWYYVSYLGMTFSFTIKTEETGARYIALEGTSFYHSDDFAPIQAAYLEKRLAGITEGKTELTVGNTYTTNDGVSFTLEKAEIREETFDGEATGAFSLYITCETELSISNEKYTTPSKTSSFGLGYQPHLKEDNTHCYSGGFEELDELEEDKTAEFAILSFTANDTPYYIHLSAFYN